MKGKIEVLKNKLKISKGNFVKITKTNEEILKRICSKSVPSWHEMYYVNANKYITCLQIHEMMDYSYQGFLNEIIGEENVIVKVDVSHMFQDDFEDNFDSQLKKQQNAQDDAKKARKYIKASEKVQELMSFDRELKETRNSPKTMTIRIYLFARTIEELQEDLDMMVNKLSRIDLKGYVQLNNLDEDYRALTSHSDPVKKLVSSETIAELMAYSEVNRIDKESALIGYTAKGLLALNVWDFKNYSYNKAIFGGMGSGKSSLIKEMNEGQNLRGNHVTYILDIHDEYGDFAEKNGYQNVDVTEESNINFCEIFFTENEDGVIRKNDIQNRISIMVANFESVNMFGRQQTLKELALMFNDIYIEKYLNKNINKLESEDWILLEEVLFKVEKMFETGKYMKVQEEDMNNIRLGLKYMIENYGYLYNCHTNMDFDLNESIRFNISFLMNNSDDKVRSSYISLLMNYCSYGVYLNLQNNKAMERELGISLRDMDSPFVTHEIKVDETKKYTDDVGFLITLLSIMKYQRKAYSGTTLVFHTLHDVELGEDVKNVSEQTALLQQVFGLCTNKFIGKLDGDSLNKLPKVVKGINENDCNMISRFEKGMNGERKFFLLDDRGRKTIFTSIVTKYQQSYFGGGN